MTSLTRGQRVVCPWEDVFHSFDPLHVAPAERTRSNRQRSLENHFSEQPPLARSASFYLAFAVLQKVVKKSKKKEEPPKLVAP